MEEIKRYILAGGPSCGKSTSIDLLDRMGFPVVTEVAREVLSERKGLDYVELQKEIFKRQVAREDAVRESSFFDRSALEGVAYSLLKLGKIPEPLASYDFRNKYTQVFFLERLPFVQDGLRVEKDDAEAERVHQAIYGIYRGYGYDPITVPVFPGSFEESVAKRVEFILSRLEILKGGVN
jgi:predicted ATPase